MSEARTQIVAAARAWVGTPYVHQASLQGVGCDCLGLVRGVFRQLCGHEPEGVPPYTPDWSEASGDERLWAAAARHLAEVPAGQARAGDVVLMRMREGSVAKHLGILAGNAAGPTLVHAYSRIGVVESPLTQPWARLIVAAFAFPGSDD
jgi:NlpC/P60 family putative phage cell wall peptidase